MTESRKLRKIEICLEKSLTIKGVLADLEMQYKFVDLE